MKGWPNICKGSLYKAIWKIGPSILVWELWKERNKRLFQDKKMDVINLFNEVEATIVETTNNRLRYGRLEDKTFSSWDSKIRKE